MTRALGRETMLGCLLNSILLLHGPSIRESAVPSGLCQKLHVRAK